MCPEKSIQGVGDTACISHAAGEWLLATESTSAEQSFAGTSIVPISLMKKLRFTESLPFSITQHLVILAGVVTVSLP